MSKPANFETDIIQTADGELEITFLGHGTLMFRCQDQVIHIDPYSSVADYTRLPKADLVLITHEHGDHLDPQALSIIRQKDTLVVANQAAVESIPDSIVLQNGQTANFAGFQIEAVPAYNIVHKRESGGPFHPKGRGNGYVLTLGGQRVYIAGDTEDIPEMNNLKAIDIAFLPMNLPYTMTPEMAARAAKRFRPRVLYPYHFGSTDTARLVQLLADEDDIQVRIRSMA